VLGFLSDALSVQTALLLAGLAYIRVALFVILFVILFVAVPAERTAHRRS